MVKLLQPYGVTILACDRVHYSNFYRQHGAEKVDANELWARSDVLTTTCRAIPPPSACTPARCSTR